jgi:hypothetical protein
MVSLGAAAPVWPLTERDIADHAARPWNKSEMMNRRVRLGTHHGAYVVADYPCSDVCPDYTTRIIHYDIPPGIACAGVGGVLRYAIVPSGGISANRRAFCVPTVLGQETIPLGGG